LPKYGRRVVGKILQLARCIERLERFEKCLQAAQSILPVLLLLLGQNRPTPENEFRDTGLGGDGSTKEFAHTLLNLRDCLIPVRGVDDVTFRHVQKIAEVLKRSEGQIARTIDMLELGDLSDTNLCKLIDASRVDPLTSEAHDDVTAVDQRGENYTQELRLNTKLRPIVDAGLRCDQLGAIEDLARSFQAGDGPRAQRAQQSYLSEPGPP
jgi:hypothetical protein